MTRSEQPMIKATLTLIEALTEFQPKFDAVNKATFELYGDFGPHVTPVAECIYGQLIKLLDAVLSDDDVASYFLHECSMMKDGGAISLADGATWRLKSVDDLRVYLDRPISPDPSLTAGMQHAADEDEQHGHLLQASYLRQGAKEIDTLRARVTALEAALRIFADAAISIDGHPKWIGNGRRRDSELVEIDSLTMGHLRAARAAMEGKQS